MPQKNEMPEWAMRIRHLREDALGLSQGKFAKLFKNPVTDNCLTPVAISAWERGVTEPSPAHFIRMGNIAPTPEQRIYFWECGGVDITVMRSTAMPRGDKKRQKRAAGVPVGEHDRTPRTND